jgi:hypothetical protein
MQVIQDGIAIIPNILLSEAKTVRVHILTVAQGHLQQPQK